MFQVGDDQQDTLKGSAGAAEVSLVDLGAGEAQIKLNIVGIAQDFLVCGGLAAKGSQIQRLSGGLQDLFDRLGLAIEHINVGRLRPAGFRNNRQADKNRKTQPNSVRQNLCHAYHPVCTRADEI